LRARAVRNAAEGGENPSAGNVEVAEEGRDKRGAVAGGGGGGRRAKSLAERHLFKRKDSVSHSRLCTWQ